MNHDDAPTDPNAAPPPMPDLVLRCENCDVEEPAPIDAELDRVYACAYCGDCACTLVVAS